MRELSNKKYFDVLQQLGLSAGESAIYSVLLERGPLTARQLAKHAVSTRTNTYHLLKNLEAKHLVFSDGSGPRRVYQPESPLELERIFKEREQQLKSAESALRGSLDGMLSEFRLSHRSPGVYRFEGKGGLMKVYNDLIRDGADVCSIQDRRKLRDFLGEYNEHWLALRRKRKIRNRIITTKLQGIKEISADDRRDLREVKYIDEPTFSFDIDLKVTEEKVVLTTFREDSAVGIIIADKDIASNFGQLFEYLWKRL